MIEDHVAEPAEILIVSPLEAELTQEATLVRSALVVHIGLDPVHAALIDRHANNIIGQDERISVTFKG